MPTQCIYYPCSKYGNNCTYCYCIFYPCKDLRSGGKFVETEIGYKLWDCTDCKIIHREDIVKLIHLDKNEINKRKVKLAWLRVKSILDGKND